MTKQLYVPADEDECCYQFPGRDDADEAVRATEADILSQPCVITAIQAERARIIAILQSKGKRRDGTYIYDFLIAEIGG